MANQVVVKEKKGRTVLGTSYNRGLVLVAASVPAFAMAVEGGGLDMTSATTQLSLGLAAVGALGAAKLAPAALAWVWGMVTRNASR